MFSESTATVRTAPPVAFALAPVRELFAGGLLHGFIVSAERATAFALPFHAAVDEVVTAPPAAKTPNHTVQRMRPLRRKESVAFSGAHR